MQAKARLHLGILNHKPTVFASVQHGSGTDLQIDSPKAGNPGIMQRMLLHEIDGEALTG